jgi:hypothetical protein
MHFGQEAGSNGSGVAGVTVYYRAVEYRGVCRGRRAGGTSA